MSLEVVSELDNGQAEEVWMHSFKHYVDRDAILKKNKKKNKKKKKNIYS